MKVIKWFTLLTSLLASLSFSGCRKPEMLDGPGMVYEPPWTAFTLTCTANSTQYQFWFTVEDREDVTLVTGACQDAEGAYENRDGIELSGEDLWKLRWLNLETLAAPGESPEDLEPIPDGSSITLSLTLPDGQVVSKNASMTLSLEIYEILLPYFKNSK